MKHRNPPKSPSLSAAAPWGLAGVLSLYLLAGCAAGKGSQGGSAVRHSRKAIEERLFQIIDAAEKKDFDRLESYHLYGPHFTKFTTGVETRLDAEASREAERTGLSRLAGLRMEISRLQIDVFGKTAVATFFMNSRFALDGKQVESASRGTLVLARDAGEWKIVHEHFSPAK